MADQTYTGLEEPLRGKWLDLMYEISRQPSIIGASNHMLYIGRKA